MADSDLLPDTYQSLLQALSSAFRIRNRELRSPSTASRYCSAAGSDETSFCDKPKKTGEQR